jgi:hypothetical protein
MIKPVATGAVAVALDKYVLMQPDMKKSLYFGGSVAIGSVAASVLAPNLPNVIPIDLGAFADKKTLSGRVMEVGLCSGAAWGINKYLLKNDITREDWTKRLGVVLASGFIGEYVSDYLTGKPMSYFK